uniref:Uncharacterized protein n=1 Tax=Nonomuraea gerenzanensis TaxID=93944 RepID=A0A1M4E8P1_9ACTN|nr:hypothetical protein BN4615_P4579 [Nonomuraea gerenzanensis]
MTAESRTLLTSEKRSPMYRWEIVQAAGERAAALLARLAQAG